MLASIAGFDDTGSHIAISDDGGLMRYAGGKGGAGVYQTIINLMPHHDVYIEAFVGGGNVLERKRKAALSIVIDRDAAVCEHWERSGAADIVVNGDAVSWLSSYSWTGRELVYCDPPYVHSTRSRRDMYQFEMTDDQHRELVSVLLTVPAAVMLSGYCNPIYDELLAGWHRVDFQAMTRGGLRTESLWLNYEPPAVPFDLAYVGENFRERERIKRKRERWRAKLEKMDLAERAVIMDALLSLVPSSDVVVLAGKV
ncbi:DNA adenine methylase [Ralstonia mannitolilytica]|uniref:DNA adenine methylase n=1 Tax=Ralstonia mannitolilytica TaxID=105219 RepID=UPI00292CC0C0|nr:DNA adenine methylase [Ralstonia mannitolilytica]